jgi:dihydroorotase
LISSTALLAARALPAAEYDLVIRGGRVLDPSQRIDRTMDVAIRAGQIAALKRDIPLSAAAESIDARGKLVVPGLIDIHVHERDVEMPPSDILSTGVTTMVDAGSRGADNLEELFGFVKAANRMRLWMNIGRLGNFPPPDKRAEFLDNLDQADVAKARAAIVKYRDVVVGIKARLSRGVAVDRDQEVLRRAIQAAEPSGIPVMIHMGDTFSPLPQLLAMMRPGDVVSHMYAPPPHGIMDEKGRVLKEVRAARKRGILFDFGHGRTAHWNWETAESALKQDFPPDTISSDLDLVGRTMQVFHLPNVLSKFLAMGMPLNQVIGCATVNASRAIKEFNKLGTLRPGSPADIAVLELTQGNFEFVDNYQAKRTGSRKLVARAVVAAGKRV